MVGFQRLLAVAMAGVFAGNSGGAKPEVLGIVVEANQARLGGSSASEGTSVFDGDRIATEAHGTLRLRGGNSLLMVPEQSRVVIHSGGAEGKKNFGAELLAGGTALSVGAGSGSEVDALGARVQPNVELATVVHVQITGPKELYVFVRQGEVSVLYAEEEERIGAGGAYRVLLDADDDSPTKKAARGKKRKITLIAIGVAAGIAAVAIPLAMRGHNLESPDRP